MITSAKDLPLDYQDLGPQQVKNIAEPIRAFAVRFGPTLPLGQPQERHIALLCPTSPRSPFCPSRI